MKHRRTFGRRAVLQAPDTPTVMRASPTPLVDRTLRGPDPASPAPPSVEDEIEAWKMERRGFTRFPWRQLSLMAGLSFGLASFVLPQSVNDAVAWPLYLLSGLGFWAGLRKRKRV